MTHVTCRLTAKNRDQLRHPTLGNGVWATFTFIIVFKKSATMWYAVSALHCGPNISPYATSGISQWKYTDLIHVGTCHNLARYLTQTSMHLSATPKNVTALPCKMHRSRSYDKIFLVSPNRGWLCYVVQKLQLQASSVTETFKSYSALFLIMTFKFLRYSGYIFSGVVDKC